MTDEAKLRVAALRWAHLHEDCNDADDTCPVQDECLRCTSVLCNIRTAANLIESLSAELEQVKRERDAAVEDLRGVCRACVHYNDNEMPFCCYFEECANGMDNWDSEDHWQWRGYQRRNNDA